MHEETSRLYRFESMGLQIKTRREELNLTQEQVSEMIGISAEYLSRVERSRSKPSLSLLLRLCDCLNLNIGNLFFQYSSAAKPAIDLVSCFVHMDPRVQKQFQKCARCLMDEPPPKPWIIIISPWTNHRFRFILSR